MDSVLDSLVATGPMAVVLFYMWWTTKKDLTQERAGREKDQRKWVRFLMSHMTEANNLENDDDDEEA